MSLVQIVEHVLLHAANRAQQRRARPRPEPEPVAPEPPAGHVVLGHALPRRPELVTLSPEARLRHVYALGGTGCGKTNLLLRLIESDIAARRTFCVVDLRGDLVDRVLLRLARDGDPGALAERTLLLDLRQEEFAVGFNPLAGPGDPHARALHVLSVLRRQSDSWGVQLEETLRNCLVALAVGGGTLLDVDPLLHDARFRQGLLSRVSDGPVRAFFGRYGQLSGERQSAWSLPVINKVTPLLATPVLRRLLGQRQGFAFGPLLDGPPGGALLVSLAVDRLQQSAYQAGALLVSAFQTAIMARVDRPEGERMPVHLYVDEFETMATEQFESIVAEGRRFGLGLCLSHQNLGQLPAGLRQVLLNNVQTQLYFQTGAGDAADLAREIVGAGPAEEVRQALMTQAVGEAYLVRRGQPAVRLRVPHRPDPDVAPAAVRALREAVLRRHGRPSADVDREQAAREAPTAGEAAPGPDRAADDRAADGKGLAGARRLGSKEEGYEIRHAPLRAKFARKPPEPNAEDPEPGAGPKGGIPDS